MSSHHPDAETLMARLSREAEQAGYHLNPDREFVLDLMDGLLANQERFGYRACPCMEADGVRAEDLDIICPCEYRDADLEEHGCCFCGLYVSASVARGEAEAKPIPLRRDPDPAMRPQAMRLEAQPASGPVTSLEALVGRAGARHPLWRCTACGYLASRERPPLACPICKADQDRFEALASPSPRPLWRCTVCGYLASRETPPEECPICWAAQDRFELLA
ncbi:MAG: ferredoxin-thioredoxin reductase catalytic domain-containing protein [Polyangia bacterium]|jgi:ferredoxin-thioredoxin reductase catalytic subunit/rubredoxin|nr:ferredoxin-thioredoxin reductase catalytic domain-containing protein [Polyangia bacterium]